MRGKKSNIVGEEHLTIGDKGDLTGLFSVDGTKARAHFGNTRFWEGVEHLITEYSILHPGEMDAITIDNAVTRSTNRNTFGGSDTGAIRHCLSLPYGLLTLLEEYEPTLFTNKKTRHQFMRLYPRLRSCEIL